MIDECNYKIRHCGSQTTASQTPYEEYEWTWNWDFNDAEIIVDSSDDEQEYK